jgi:hypothetical protein
MLLPVVVLIFCLLNSFCNKQVSVEEQAVVSTVDQFFEAIAKKDAAIAKAALLPEGRIVSIREDGDEIKISGSAHEDFLQRLPTMQGDLLERMWDPTVLIHGRLATVWTPYDFHRNQEFSHCGYEVFNLVKTAEGWRIAGVVYTVEPTGCELSPLGPPR